MAGSKLNITWQTEQVDHVALYLTERNIVPQYGQWFIHPVSAHSYLFTVPHFSPSDVSFKQIYIEGHLADHQLLGAGWLRLPEIREGVCDFIPPSPPRNFRIIKRTAKNHFTFVWDEAYDNPGGSGIKEYAFYVSGLGGPSKNDLSIMQVPVGSTTWTNEADILLKSGAPNFSRIYIYMKAIDQQGNFSENSNAVAVESIPISFDNKPRVREENVLPQTKQIRLVPTSTKQARESVSMPSTTQERISEMPPRAEEKREVDDFWGFFHKKFSKIADFFSKIFMKLPK